MPGRVYEADLAVPAATAPAAPLSAVWQMETGTLVSVRIVVPPGHNGLTGICVVWAGTPIIPYGGAPYIIANDDKMEWEINQDINIGSVTVQAYNTDIWPHTFYLRGLVVGLPMPPGVDVPNLAAVPASTSAAVTLVGTVSSRPAAAAAAPGRGLLPVDRTPHGLVPRLLRQR